ncbi:MAG: D-glycero-beta-D-manno-heptose 1,7-bisphosphate 7-phosphatase [Desulfobacterium sp.]|jgi:D-glycero-D-manno-heptose 1,7-bisphosphate phosphatase|nr:D-glycero-beta-D-manno-heptose 1,7-bisphosphate 7-phosphatase [Desulfobacterium sp.]
MVLEISPEKPTVFLDRDGVINFDSASYIKKPEEFRFIPDSAEAVALLSKNGFNVILITNQSMINRKISTLQNLEAIFETMKSGIRERGGQIHDIFYCPHAPDEGCLCRKPAPGMIDLACGTYGIDPSTSFMVGDSAKDMECAGNAGVGKAVLVLTGNGRKAIKNLGERGMKPDFVALNLMDAVRWIIRYNKAHGASEKSEESLKEP